MKYPEDYIDRIICGDCLEVMKGIPDNTVDLIVTSPPYNVGIDYGEGREKDKINISDYQQFAFLVFSRIFSVIKNGGRVCIEIGGSGRNFPLSWIWQDAAYKNELKLFSEITIEHRKTNATAWGSWLSPNNVYTIPNFHLLYVFYKETSTKIGQKTDIKREEFIEWTRGRWKIKWEKHRGHPASFPSEIPKRCVKLFGHIDDIVLDPFIGSGTTAVVCKQLKRRFIGIEIKEKYYKIAQEQIRQEILF